MILERTNKDLWRIKKRLDLALIPEDQYTDNREGKSQYIESGF